MAAIRGMEAAMTLLYDVTLHSYKKTKNYLAVKVSGYVSDYKGSTVKVHRNHPDSTKPPKGSVYTTNDHITLQRLNPHTKTDMHYHLHLSWSLRDYPLTGSPTRPYVSSLSMRRD